MTCHIQLKESLRFSHAFDEINTADLVAKCLPLNIRAVSWPWTQMRACTLTSPFINQQPRDYGCDLQRSLELPVIYLNCPLPGSSPINALIVLTHIGNWFQNQTKLSQMINKKFLIWLPGEKETNDIYTNDNIRTGTQLHQGIPQSKKRERERERDSDPDSDLSEDGLGGLAAPEFWRLQRFGWDGRWREPYGPTVRDIAESLAKGLWEINWQCKTIPALSAVPHSFHDSKIVLNSTSQLYQWHWGHCHSTNILKLRCTGLGSIIWKQIWLRACSWL